MRLGRLLGFEIRLDASWFLVFGLLTWSLAMGVFPAVYGFGPGASWALGILAALLLFASVVAHELSHAVVARMFKIEVSAITLFLFGGVAQIKGEPGTPLAELLIAAAGPIVSFLLGMACLGLSWTAPTLAVLRPAVAIVNYLGVINVALALFNLIPGFPLDGGRILRAIVWRITGSLARATKCASASGQFFGWAMILWGLFRFAAAHDLGGLWLVFVGWFLNSSAQAAYQQIILRKALQGVAIGELVTDEVPQVDGDIRIPAFVQNYLLRHDYPVYPVVRKGEFMGIVTVEDVKKLERDFWGVTSVGALARVPDEERVVEDDRDAWDVLTQMLEHDASRLLVVQHGKLLGIVSREAILRLAQLKTRFRPTA
jgi:Zn-dependent protease